MKMNLFNKVFVCPQLIIFLSLCFVMTSNLGIAEEWSRKGKGEIYVLGQSLEGDTTTGTIGGLTQVIEFDDTIVGGLGFGLNFNDHLNLNTTLFFGSMDMTGRVSDIQINGDTDLFGWDVNMDINILKTRFTPLLTGGIGYIIFDGSWEGPYGDSDFSETDFSYNLGGGFRWDVHDHFVIKALYKATWTELEDADDNVMFDGISLSIGYVF